MSFAGEISFENRLTVGLFSNQWMIITSKKSLSNSNFLVTIQVGLSLRTHCIILAVIISVNVMLIVVLATRGVIAVTQTETYGDIFLKMSL